MKPGNDLPRISRRAALQWISAATVAIPLLENESPAAKPPRKKVAVVTGGYGPDPDLMPSYKPGDLWPLTFSDSQRSLMIVLCDIIIPADEHSPSASSQGVQDFIDEWISSPYPDQKPDRDLILKGLAWFDDEAKRRGGKNFVSLSSQEQTDVCRQLAKAAKTDSRKFPGSMFQRLRDLIAGGYYTTPAGMKDLGYRGNVPMTEWKGPSHEVLKHLGLSPQSQPV